MSVLKGEFDSFRVEEAYNWRDDIMEITRKIVRETDEARLNNIAEHFEVDLSEIREFIEMKRKKTQKPLTNADRIRAMTDEELADFLDDIIHDWGEGSSYLRARGMWVDSWDDWLKQEAKCTSE